MKLKREEISDRVVQRLTEYLTILVELEKTQEFINSNELSKIMNTTSAQVRKDLSTFGEFGIRGKGYEISNLKEIIEDILGINTTNRIILVGHGKMGEMITSNSVVLGKGFYLVGVYDKNPKKIGQKIEHLGIEISDIKDIKKEVKRKNIDTAILSVNKDQAQVAVDNLISCGIKAILNMTTYKLEVPSNISVVSIDISARLQELNFWRRFNENN